ncbi:hypothetical protein A9299_05150 [Moraxella osloensis]|uniref:Uncharacterized protein n=1 Tax=Faucicola osloensis TaxID=34062 RepID=A0AA91J984_FAUOS|nr:hypothetical protein [Moraxella osloensis]OBX62565.1 hypothetical protein A9299_05150 [Moraxella osloensis]
MNAQQAIAFSIKPLTFAIVMLGIHGCATQPSASQPLSQRVLQANQNLVSRQSYAYDYRVNVVRPPLRGAQALAASPNRLKLIQQLSKAKHLDARQQALVTEGVNHQTREQSEAGQVMDILTKRFEFASTGVVDLRRGQMSIVPEFRYVQNNAGAFIKVPLAADFTRSKVYADLSGLSEFATDPQYDGRYIEYDYSKLLKDKKIDKRALFKVFEQMSLLNATLAKESDYQPLALTTEDKAKGVSQRIGYRIGYNQMLAEYLLFFHVNKRYLKSFINPADFAKDDELKQLGSLAVSPRYLMKKAFDSHELASVEEKAYESAMRLYEAIDKMRAQSDDSAADPASADATEAMDSLETQTATDESTTDESTSDELGQTAKALAAFDKYQSDKLVSAAALAKIIDANPQAFKALQAEISKEANSSFMSMDDDIRISYGLNRHNQLLNMVAMSDLPSFEKTTSPTNQPKTQMRTVVNFYDYGKARVNPDIFNKAITWQQASKDNNLWAATKQSKVFDSDKNLEALSYSLLKQNKGFVETFVTLYTYQFVLQKDEASLSEIDMAALNAAATKLAKIQADNYAVINTDSRQQEAVKDFDAYVDDELAEHIAGIVDKTYRNQQYLQQIAKLKAQGKSDAQIFSQLYQTISDKPSDVASDVASDVESAAAAAVDIVEDSEEQQACSVLLDTDKLDKKSRTRLAKICEKIDTATAQEQAASQQSGIADTASASTAVDIAKQTQARDKFNQLLGEIAIEDMQTQAKHISLSDEDDELIEKLKPHFEASYDFDYDAYKAAYQLLLLSQ